MLCTLKVTVPFANLEETVSAGEELALTVSLPLTTILKHRSLAARGFAASYDVMYAIITFN